MTSRPRRAAPKRLLALIGAVIVLGGAVAPVTARSHDRGYLTGQDEMLISVADGASAKAIVTVGEIIGGYRFESLPDGISVRDAGHGQVEAFVNHETSTVAFPYNAAGPTTANSLNDFDNAQLSRLVLDRNDGGVLDASMVITSAERFQRFCSNFLATREQGFSRDILFTNEEATDFVFRQGKGPEWTAPIPAGTPNAEQAGVVVAYDVTSGARKPIYGMGRLNHENSVAIPGFKQVVLLTGDDTFTTNPAGSQVYAYLAGSADEVWNDQGDLWGFRAKDWHAYNDYYDVLPDGSTPPIEGEFVKIDKAAATGDQTALENASDAAGVFEFVRVEDIAYDREDPNVIYIADSGRANAANGIGVMYDSTGARVQQPASFASRNGRIWKMVLDPKDPRHVLSLTILIEGDDIPLASQDATASLAAIHQPDNLETTKHSLLITEDPSSSNQYPIATGNTARLWWYHLDGPKKGTMEVAFKVDQSADQGLTDRDPTTQTPPGPVPAGFGLGTGGSWETSGIVDVSKYFGRGWFLIDVQAHTLWVDIANGPDATAPTGPDWLYKREGGQLLLVKIPGA
jgi:hypothetical protein